MADETTNEAKLAKALRRCISALREVQPQVHGALPVQSLTYAIEWGEEALEECESSCANCGNPTKVGQVYCEDCELARTGASDDD